MVMIENRMVQIIAIIAYIVVLFMLSLLFFQALIYLGVDLVWRFAFSFVIGCILTYIFTCLFVMTERTRKILALCLPIASLLLVVGLGIMQNWN